MLIKSSSIGGGIKKQPVVSKNTKKVIKITENKFCFSILNNSF
jgi:hypothetical protein